MSIETIAAVEALAASEPVAGATQATQPAGFGDWFMREVSNVDQRVLAAENDANALATGQVKNLHEVMIRMEEAKLSFQLLAQVRNRMLEAYQEVMHTQV